MRAFCLGLSNHSVLVSSGSQVRTCNKTDLSFLVKMGLNNSSLRL